MPVYDIDGNELTSAFDVNANALSSAFTVDGTEIPIEVEPDIPDIPVTPMSWSMSDEYKQQILDVLDYMKTYKRGHSSAYAICQFNDIHLNFSGNEPNFIDYNKGYKVLSAMLFLGDMTNNAYATQYTSSYNYMTGAQASNRLIGMGNHEYMSYNASQGNPETIYGQGINVDVTFMPTDNNALIYYYDDTKNNVRYILLDYFYILKSGNDSSHLLDDAQLNWLAGVMQSAGDKDIIIGAHSMLSPFLVLESGRTLSSTATLTNYQNLIDLIVAWKARGTYTVTVDGVSQTYSFANCTGEFVMYTTGHYHALGYGDFGFNMFTCPTMGTPYGGSHRGFTFYLIDKALKTLKVFQCSPALTTYLSYDYTYGGNL